MDTTQRQIALSLLEALREELIYAHLNNGSRVIDINDLRQYLQEQIVRIRTSSYVMAGYGMGEQHAIEKKSAGGQAAE